MPDVANPDLAARARPRWTTLVLLVAGVLSLHLLLLTGGLPQFKASAATASSAPPTVPEADQGSRLSGNQGANPVIRTSTVRWIVPAPVTAPVPEKSRQAALPAAPKPSARVAALKPAAPVALPAPVEETLSPPADETAVSPPGEDSTVLAQATRAEPAASNASEPAAGKTLPPARPPASARLKYVVAGQIKGFSYSATGTLDWELSGGRYNARMEMRMPLLGSRVQTSTGAVGPGGLLPERFADKGRSERAAHFEREQQRIRFSANTPEAELLPGAQDRLSLFLQIAGLLQARPQAYASGQIIDMQVAGTGDAEIWRFQVGEESTLALPAGELRVRHLVRQPRKEFDSTVEMWLAPGMNHLPVRLKVTQANGDVADQQLAEKP